MPKKGAKITSQRFYYFIGWLFCVSINLFNKNSTFLGLKSYGLKNFAQILDIKFKHHDALEDAKVCGIIGRKIFKEFHIKKPNDIEKEFNLEVGSFIKDWKWFH